MRVCVCASVGRDRAMSEQAANTIEEVNKVMEEVINESKEVTVPEPKHEDPKPTVPEVDTLAEERKVVEDITGKVAELIKELFHHQDTTHEEFDKVTDRFAANAIIVDELLDGQRALREEIVNIKKMMNKLYSEQEAQAEVVGDLKDTVSRAKEKKQKRELGALETLKMLNDQLSHAKKRK